MNKGCLYMGTANVKGEIERKNTKSSTKLGTLCQVRHPVYDSQKKFKGGHGPLGVGY